MTEGFNFDGGFFFQYLFHPPAIILWGLWFTIWIAVVAQFFGVIIGMAVTAARNSRNRWLIFLAKTYVWAWLGTPVLVQLVLIYTGVAASGLYGYPDFQFAGVTISGAVQAAIAALSLNEAAYMSEIYRAALSAIDKGQFDAARAIGMRPLVMMRWIIFPQTIRLILPPLGNEFTLMLKGTSLLTVLGIRELFSSLQSINATTFRTFELFSIAAIWYLLLTTVMSIVQWFLEHRFGRHLDTVRSVPRLKPELAARP